MGILNVLIACEESQIICSEFRKLGHNAFSCDIQKTSGSHPEWHILCDVLEILNPHVGHCTYGIWFRTMDTQRHYVPKWDLIIAHPPCTYLAASGSTRLYPKPGCIQPDRYKKGVEAADFFYKIYNCNCKHICIENPRPLKIFNLPPCSQYIEPYLFGDPYSKRTLLWLKGLPPLFATLICSDFQSWTKIHSSQKVRSKTFPGIAAAIASQYSDYLS